MSLSLPFPGAVAAAFDQALLAGAALAGATAPNPPVGCAALAADGEILAVGAHHGAGLAHAEAAVLDVCRQAGRLDAIAALVVTLEPCNHQGRTPPCVAAILASPVRAVWIGARDPNPAVAGGGAQALGDAGLIIGFAADLPHPDASALARRCARLIAPFSRRVRTGRPWVTVKQALRADGAMIPPAGSKTFTSEASLDLAHSLRRRADAIVTGSGTILADNPWFTVRRVADPRTTRRRLAILDRRGRVPASYLVQARERGLVPSVHPDWPGLLTELAADGALEVLVEAGPTLSGAVLASGLWDEHVLIRAADPSGGVDPVETLLAQDLEIAA
ncbi:bifunctional diaminohydroxyphosphoribosylaminopyrimidine deaminase/5-amino-6-(5-phosphoribosylamino)uracil reductase RibD [Caulobacter sp. X]|uniref:bifunctional diaminohydroxyphosphoribosylaminopyrimidine deaminase/5-amino-6-(5-phosphoribosylamino)uracil reductase RibD n=1 Tax=Caulobacter sp. X TaxID=2048901 RepID=UPI000C14FDFD|nr:bifunctional diaminohydroxyphosphoribosylaminopyrimidine deaminase/5-amino-6-(5-phosphoribosylamino)uracil reductase RibD [Caulobacter sp. X]PIB96919.1 riboflavin biosynthesis protein RibD [Caulobacter sp. X]